MEETRFQRAIVVGDTTYVVRALPRGGILPRSDTRPHSGPSAWFPTLLGATGFLVHHVVYGSQWELQVHDGAQATDGPAARVIFVKGRRAAEDAMGSVVEWLAQGRPLENFNVYFWGRRGAPPTGRQV